MTTASSAPREARRRWLLLTVFVIAAIIVASSASVSQLATLWWTNDSYGHGLLVIPISVWLIWRVRGPLLTLETRPSLLGLALVFASSLFWLASEVTSTSVGSQLALVVLIVSVVWSLLGFQTLKLLLFPLSYLLVAVPVWEILVPPLRDVTAVMSADFARSFGVPIFKEGRFLHIPGGTFVIADVCAGLRFFLASVSISTLYAYLSYSTFTRASVFVAAAIAWAILFNWIRVFFIILIGHHWGIDSPIVQDHNMLGWGLFAVSMLPLFGFGSWMAHSQPEPSHVLRGEMRTLPGRRAAWIASLAVVLAAAGPAAYFFGSPSSAHLGAQLQILQVAADGGWRGPIETENRLGGLFPGAQDYTRDYRRGDDVVQLQVAYHPIIDREHELVGAANRFYDSTVWGASDLGAGRLTTESGEEISYKPLILRTSGGESRVAWLWYDIGGRTTGDDKVAKLHQLLSLLKGKPGGGAVIVSVPVLEDVSHSEQSLGDFVRRYGSQLPGVGIY